MADPFLQLADADAFEALCYDILVAQGFSDVRWRGPGADGGRDLEARWATRDPTGSELWTRWYVECKWYEDSVPFSEIEPKLLAASTARADYLLVMTSSRIRNTAYDSVDEWLRNRGNPFRVRYWIGHDILSLAARNADVFERHFAGGAVPVSWAIGEQRLRKLKALAETSADRLTWRIGPTIQWVARSMRGATINPRVAHELDLLESLIRAHGVFSLAQQVDAAKRTQSLSECVRFAVDCVERRRPGRLQLDLGPDSQIKVSRPLLVSALFEILLNAALYGSATAHVTSEVQAGRWRVAVANASDEKPLVEWPQLGWRGQIAQQLNTAGQGLGCWLASEASKLTGVRAIWQVESERWVASLEGGTEQ